MLYNKLWGGGGGGAEENRDSEESDLEKPNVSEGGRIRRGRV